MLLENAGLTIEPIGSEIDERAVEAAIEDSGLTPADLADILAEAKAIEVSERFPDALVIGGDQTLSLDELVLHKAENMEEARYRLLALSGRTHELNSAIVIAKNGQVIWRHVEIARMTMRKLEPGFIGRYLAGAGDTILKSVGAYQIEGPGIQLFEKIEGDYFTIVGVPLLQLLGELRNLGAIDG